MEDVLSFREKGKIVFLNARVGTAAEDNDGIDRFGEEASGTRVISLFHED